MNKQQAFHLRFQISEYQRLMETAKRPDYLGEWAKELACRAWTTFMSEYDEIPTNRHYRRSIEWKLERWHKNEWPCNSEEREWLFFMETSQ